MRSVPLFIILSIFLAGCASPKKQSDDILVVTGIVTEVVIGRGLTVHSSVVRKEFEDHLYVRIEDAGTYHGRSFYFIMPRLKDVNSMAVGDRIRFTVVASEMKTRKDGDLIPLIECTLVERGGKKEANQQPDPTRMDACFAN